MSEPGPLRTTGLCAACRHAAVVVSRRSRFLRCRRAERDRGYAKYPTLPVERCAGYEPEATGVDETGSTGAAD